MSRLALVALALAACGTTPDDGDDDGIDVDAGLEDADAQPDAISCLGTCPLPDAGDGGAGLPINAACEPTLDQCAPGLACRIRDAHDGICRAAGTMLEGQVCTSADQCGAALACIPDSPGVSRCFLICDVAAPARCASSQRCAPFWGDDTGVCI
jgi:hypothetical protein